MHICHKYSVILTIFLCIFCQQLNDKADKCAQYYLDKGTIDHTCPDKGRVGENLYWRGGTDIDATAAVSQAIKLWYDEIKDYDFTKNKAKAGKAFGNIGHFTQVVWKGSKKLGVGYAAKDGKGICVVSLYDPPGNFQGQYPENVLMAVKGKNAGRDGKDGDSSASPTRNALARGLGIIMVAWLL